MAGSKIDYSRYEAVIGLEVHAQLLTASKIFCSDDTTFGQAPNTQVSPLTLGHPGTLPVLNRQAVRLAVKMGLACHCQIAREMYFDRKNYFYPDLPKGYQITQQHTPICRQGYIPIKTAEGNRNILLHHIHLEEDAGKSLHDQDPFNTYLDYNRAGVPLIEIVSEPDMHSADEAYAYLTELRKLVRYLDICDGNMEEGSLRCDANISIRLKGSTELGTKVEIKNLNSIRNVKRAIEFEINRQVIALENGETIIQQTRSFDAGDGTTTEMRSKEMANDYRYFPEPDLAPVRISEEMLEAILREIPALPEERRIRYIQEGGLREQEAAVLAEDRDFADYFEGLIKAGASYKAAANWMLGPVKSYLNEQHLDIAGFPLKAASLAQLIALVENGTFNFSLATSAILPSWIGQPEKDPLELAKTLDLLPETDAGMLGQLVDDILAAYPEKVKDFQKGKKGLLGMFVGEVMKRSQGKADPKLTNKLLLEKLKN